MGVIKRQGIQSALITYAGMITGFISLLVVQPWLLTTEEIGLTRVIYSFSFLLSTLIPMSAGNITTRFFPQFRNEHERHHGFLGLVLLMTLIGGLIVLSVVFILREQIKLQYVDESPLFAEYFFVVFPLSLIVALISVVNTYLYAVFRPLLPALAQEVLIRLFFIALIVVYSFGFMRLHTFVLCFAGTYLLQLAIISIQVFRIGPVSLIPDKTLINPKILKGMLSFGFTILGAGVASMAIKLLDAVVLGKYVHIGLVGVYGIAAFIPTFIEAPVTALDKVANSRVAHSLQHGEMDNIRSIYFQSSRFLFLLGGILFLLVVLNVKYLFQWLPPEFIPGIPVVKILSLAALFNLMTGSNTAIIFNSEKFRWGALALIGVAVINLILLFILIPKFGIIGAAWATCISSFIYNLFKYSFIYFKFRLQPFDRKTLFIVLAILAGYAAGSIVPASGIVIIDVAVHAIAGSAGYLPIIWYSKAASDLKNHFNFGFLKHF
ncbi:MAG: polysaccharide biosynthesis C-terminal domain-containing protein [Bacteroidia bacterium]